MQRVSCNSRSSVMKVLAFVVLVQAYIAAANPAARITGGKDAFPGQFPYQVAIQYGVPPLVEPKTVCGGSILNEKWILTSASCVTLIPKIGKAQVKAGKHENDKDSEWVQTSEVLLRLVHKDYKGIIKKIKPYDIGLLKLKTPLSLNERVQPIRLPKAYTKPKGSAILTGWGSISTNVIPKLPNALQVADVEIISKPNCEDAIRTIEPAESISDLQICSGPLDKPISACVGDIGDPLVQLGEGEESEEGGNEDNKSAVQIGIASWAAYPCGAPGAPTVYTLVSAFVYWIEERISENA